jgi:hypothetical protein
MLLNSVTLSKNYNIYIYIYITIYIYIYIYLFLTHLYINNIGLIFENLTVGLFVLIILKIHIKLCVTKMLLTS